MIIMGVITSFLVLRYPLVDILPFFVNLCCLCTVSLDVMFTAIATVNAPNLELLLGSALRLGLFLHFNSFCYLSASVFSCAFGSVFACVVVLFLCTVAFSVLCSLLCHALRSLFCLLVCLEF